MLFKPLQYDSGKVKTLGMTSDTEIAKGDPLTFSSGYPLKAVNTETEAVRFVALESITTGNDETADLLAVYAQGVEFEAEAKNSTDQDQVNYAYPLHTDGTVANATNATGNIFLVTKIVGAATDKLVRGYFLDRVNI